MNNNKQTILVVANKMPYPPHSGDQIRKWNLLLILSKYFDIDLVVITEIKVSISDIEILYKYCKKVKIFYYPKYRFILNTLKFPFNKWSLEVNYYYFKEVKKYIDINLHEYKYFFANMLRTAIYSEGFKGDLIVDIVDSYTLGYQESIKNVQSILWRLIYEIEIPRLRHTEQYYNKLAKETYYVNNRDVIFWGHYGNSIWTPNGVNETIFETKEIILPNKSISFLGKMDYQPNIDAMIWFESNVFFNVPSNIDFYILGQKPTRKLLLLYEKYSNVKITGFIEDPFKILKSSFCVVAPMQTGAGLQNKVLEAMAIGKIVILSSYAAKPIVGGIHKVHFLVADDGATFLEYIDDILKDKTKYEYIEKNAQKLIKETYNWNQLESRIKDLSVC